MNILNKLTDIFKRNIMFYIKIDPPDKSPKNNKIEEIYFKGAWEEDGEARWVFFKTEDEYATARLNPEPFRDRTLDGSDRESFSNETSDMPDKKSFRDRTPDGSDRKSFSNEISDMPDKESFRDRTLDGSDRKSFSNKTSYMPDKESFRDRTLDGSDRKSFSNEISDIHDKKSFRDRTLDGSDRKFFSNEISDMPDKKSFRDRTSDITDKERVGERVRDGKNDTVEGGKETHISEKYTHKTLIEKEMLQEEYQSEEIPVSRVKEEVVSITKLGYNMACRYSQSPKTTSVDTPAQLIDQRDIIRNDKIKVFFVEDNKSFQLVLKTLIKYSQETELSGWASDGQEALEKLKVLSPFPDVILMDISMPKMDGISATKELFKFNPCATVIMLTAFGDKEHVVDAFESGASGFLRKDAPLPIVEEAIKQAARGGRPVYKEISTYVKEVKQTFKHKTDYMEISSEPDHVLNKEIPREVKEICPYKEPLHKYCRKAVKNDSLKISCEEKITKKIEHIEHVIKKVEKHKQILDEIIEKIEEKENFSDIKAQKDYKNTCENITDVIDEENEIKEKILYFKSLMREKPKKIDEIITECMDFQKKYPENMDLCIYLGILFFKKNLFKEGLIEFSKSLYNIELLDKKSIQKIINYDIILSQNSLEKVPERTETEYTLTDEVWEKIKPLIPERKKKSGRIPMDDRKAMNAIFYVFHKGCPWKKIPKSLGAGSTVHNRFQKWLHAGVFDLLSGNGVMGCNIKMAMKNYCKRR